MMKRAFDVMASAMGLIILFPLFLLIAIAIKLGPGGPIFYRATRVGQYGRLFTVYKLRTMVVDADKYGPPITAAGDSRVTPSGRFLRRTKLDELPQLINVLRGEMSLVGPRPEDPRFVAMYTVAQRGVLKVRPGITSLASVKYRHEEAELVGTDWETRYIREVMPEKLAIDLAYAKRATFLQDIAIIWQTFMALWS